MEYQVIIWINSDCLVVSSLIGMLFYLVASISLFPACQPTNQYHQTKKTKRHPHHPGDISTWMLGFQKQD